MVVDYGRDAQSRIREVGVTIGAAARQILLNNATYLPAGPSTGWTYGNGRTLVRSFDKDYRALTVKGNATGSLDLGFRYDNAGYVTQVTNAALATTPQFKFSYDALGRITKRTTSANAVLEAYTVDGTGNRTSQTTGTNPATPYTYAANSHRLTQVGSVGRTFDAAGNLTSVGGTQREYAYNDAGRLKEAKQNGAITGSYLYNAKGEQVQRTAGATTTVFVYDEAGNLLGQYNNATGASIQSYVWMGGVPVGTISGTTLHYVEADHLGTPRAVVNATSQKAIWSWTLNSEAFGNMAPNTDPDADGTAFVFDLRFPGQRHDQASGLSYNYFRDYEAATGRYAQSDPIGLAGGISTYGYVAGNPLSHTDRTGLVLDTVADVGFIGYDLWVIYRDNIAGNCDNLGENLTSLGLDVLGAAVPFATGLGAAYRMRHLANAAEEIGQHGDEVMDAAQATLCAFNSFDEATLVATDRGPVRIGELTVGAKVLARNEETGEESYQTVTSKFAEWHETMRSVEVNTGTTTEALLTTDEHPFFVRGKGFIDAEDLNEGDVVQLAGGASATVTENRIVEKAQLAHNFTVANDHTYFVGETKVWVHNCSSARLASSLQAAGFARPVQSAAHHIVAGSARAAAAGRQVLNRFGININSAANGVFLPANRRSANAAGAAVHSTLHTQAYYAAVNMRLAAATTRAEAEAILLSIQRNLLSGKGP
jgi:RHS repeat-associated protein